jgi:NAD(P)-dependent dehydrogenase (short-subunit alcohol dehydrogenase family)
MGKLFDLSGQVAIVTGSTRGIGLATALRLAEHGARVVVSSRSQSDCDALARDIGKRALAIACDLNDRESLQALIESAVAAFGGLDTLVLNAARRDIAGPSAATKPDDFSAMLTANVVNNAELAHAALPHMVTRGGGAIIVVSSTSGVGPGPSAAAYSTCKRALLQLVDNWALEWASHKIRVNAIAPGLTVTDATRLVWENPGLRAAISADIPLGRLAEADDVAACALFLASRGGAFVTGQTIVVDGGRTLGRSQRGAPATAARCSRLDV